MRLDTEIIRTLMVQQGINAKELSDRIGKTKAYMSQLLNGKRTNPAFDVVSDLAKALKVDVSTILLAENDKKMNKIKINYSVDELLDDEVEQIKALKQAIGLFDFNRLELEQIAQHMQILKNSRHLF